MIEIRALSKDDGFADLILLSRQFFREYEAHHKDFFKIAELKDKHVIEYFTTFIDRDSRKAFVAMDGARVVGYITVYIKAQPDYWQVQKLGEIAGLMVHQEYRHEGIASRLLAEGVNFFSTHEVKYFTVYTAVANQAGLDFYRKNGLVPLYSTLMGKSQSTVGKANN